MNDPKTSSYKLNLRYTNIGDLKHDLGFRESFVECNGTDDIETNRKARQINNISTQTVTEINTEVASESQQLEHDKMKMLQEETLMCETHDNSELTHFCRKCEVAICQLCRPSMKHKGHRTKRIQVAVSERKEELKNAYVKGEQNRYQTLQRNFAFVEKEKASVRSSCNEVVAMIRQRCAYMKNVLDTVANNLVKEVYYKKKDCLQQYNTAQKELQNEMERSELSLECMNELLKTSDSRKFLQEFKEIKYKPVNQIKMPRIWKEYVTFENGGLSAKELKERFGTVSFVVATDGGAFTYENKQQYGRLSCKTKRSFKCERRKCLESDEDDQDNGPINAITKYNNHLWVSCGSSQKQISQLDEDGKTLRTLRLRMKVEDIACSTEGDLIVSVYRDKVIRKVTPRGEVRDLFNVPYFPKGIAMSKDGGYLVCLCDNYSTSVCEDSHRVVTKYTSEGKEERVYEFCGDAKLFTRPYRVAENSNGDICVIDKTSMGSGQVVILDKTGLLKSSYNGSKQPATQYTHKITSVFSPSDVSCDQNGRIFIAESDNHKIHLLNKDGSYIGHFMTNESDFFCPQCITTNGNNQIWIGNEYGEIKVFTCDWQ